MSRLSQPTQSNYFRRLWCLLLTGHEWEVDPIPLRRSRFLKTIRCRRCGQINLLHEL